MENNENLEVQQEQTKVEQEAPQTTNNSNAPKSANTPKVPEKSEKPLYKKWWFWVIIGIIVIAIISGGSGDTSSTNNQGGGGATGNFPSSSQNQGNSSASNNNSTNKSNLGDYNVVIESCRLVEDWDGKPVVIVKYKFTNNDDDPAAFWIALNDGVYQNGIGLNEAYLLDDSANYSSDNQMKKIKKGATLDVEVAYYLNDTTTPIEVEVCETISFRDDKVTKTFTIK